MVIQRTKPWIVTIFGVILLLADGTAEADGVNWQKVRDKDGIRIYKRSMADSRLLAFRAVSTIEAKADHIFAVLNDLEEHIHVTPGLIDLEVLREVTPFERFEYFHFKMPWPFKHRYTIVWSTLRKLPDGSIEMKMVSADEPYDNPTTYVRGQVNFANIILRPIKGVPDRWETTVEASVDPKGGIPKFMINWVFKEWPYQFLSRLDERIGIYAERQAKPQD